jgi:hypothetical protein
MMNKVWIAAALIFLCAVSIYFGLRASGMMAGTAESPVYGQSKTLIDRETMETVSVPISELMERGYNQYYNYRNLETGKFTLAEPMKCASCGKTIPRPQMTGEQMDNIVTMNRIMSEYKCPLCGEAASK